MQLPRGAGEKNLRQACAALEGHHVSCALRYSTGRVHADTRLQTRAVHARLLKARVNTRLQTVLHRVVAVGKMSLVGIILVLHFRFRWRLAR